MPALDSGQSSLIASPGFAAAFLLFLNFSGDPLRITTFGADQTFSSTGDPDLDGFTFKSFDGRALDVGAVTNSENGSDTLTITLSGIVNIDTNLLNDIAARSLWQGQAARLWIVLYDVTGQTQQGAVVPWFRGKMSSVKISPSQKTQAISLTIENYLAILNDASNRSWLNQSTYDAADTSGAATLAAANGAVRQGVGVHGVPGAGHPAIGHRVIS